MKTPGMGNIGGDQALKSQERSIGIKDKQGDLRGPHFNIPKGDFAHFLGMQKPTDQELAGQAAMSGARTIEVALHKQFNELGAQALKRGNEYRNIPIALGARANRPGEQAPNVVKDGLDAMQASVEKSSALNMRYLEMQYKFQEASNQYGTLSNLMKVRHESVKKTMSEVK